MQMDSINSISVTFLLGLSSALGVGSMPKVTDGWIILESWATHDNVETTSFSSRQIVQECKINPEAFVEFPAIIHGAHEIFLDGIKMMTFGDPTFKNIRSFYGVPIVNCDDIAKGTELKWVAYSYSKYFARVNHVPTLVRTKSYVNVFNEVFNVVAA